jgi:hypothetical protein
VCTDMREPGTKSAFAGSTSGSCQDFKAPYGTLVSVRKISVKRHPGLAMFGCNVVQTISRAVVRVCRCRKIIFARVLVGVETGLQAHCRCIGNFRADRYRASEERKLIRRRSSCRGGVNFPAHETRRSLTHFLAVRYCTILAGHDLDNCCTTRRKMTAKLRPRAHCCTYW